MKKLLFTILALAAFGCGNAQNAPKPQVPQEPQLPQGALTKEQAAEVTQQVWDWQKSVIKLDLQSQWEGGILSVGTLKMKLGGKTYGAKPADGRSLYISMHGGGNAPAATNDQQWQNQIMLYAPAEGVYVAPRAAVDDWNMWFRDHIDTFFENIIRAAMVFADVNPDKVYIMGYSAGGDGVYRMAPRLADHWAAAAMMAGHPGEVSALNLRNLPFTLWMGGDDAAYDRNKLAFEFGLKLDSLQAADPTGYVHDVHIIEGSGHWMNRVDAAAVPWMAQFRRNPYPSRVVWRQEESSLRPAFYYLSIPFEEAATGKEVRVDHSGNRFDILQCDYSSLKIWVNDQMIDFDKPVEVWCNGEQIFSSMVERLSSNILSTAAARQDPRYIFPGCINVATE